MYHIHIDLPLLIDPPPHPFNRLHLLKAKKRGVILTSRSRPLRPLDLSQFDYIIGMDPKNISAMTEAGDHWERQQQQQGRGTVLGGGVPGRGEDKASAADSR